MIMAAWSHAAELADRTPPSRNRYVDFLRAMSMLVVVVGHWLAAAPYFDATDTLTTSHILTVVPWTAWLTWIVHCRSSSWSADTRTASAGVPRGGTTSH